MRILILVTALAALASCATVAGIGEDLSTGARSVERMF